MLAISFFYGPHDSATPRDAAWLSQGNDNGDCCEYKRSA